VDVPDEALTGEDEDILNYHRLYGQALENPSAEI